MLLLLHDLLLSLPLVALLDIHGLEPAIRADLPLLRASNRGFAATLLDHGQVVTVARAPDDKIVDLVKGSLASHLSILDKLHKLNILIRIHQVFINKKFLKVGWNLEQVWEARSRDVSFEFLNHSS